MFLLTRPARSGVLAAALVSAVTLLSACGPSAAAPAPVAPKVAPATAVAVETVRHGDIQQSLAYSGDIRAREQISVLPKAAGRVERLLVDVGSRVKAGDALAVLEQDNAEIAVLQASAALAGAEAKLATLQAGPRDEDVAAAQAGLNQQFARLQNLRTGGRAEDIKAAEAGVAAAQAKMQALMNGADDGVRQAQQSAVDSDRDAVASAEAAYAALGGQNATIMQQAQSQVDTLEAQLKSAQATIDSAEAALANLPGSSAADLQAAQGAYDQALSQLGVAQAALKQSRNPTQADIAQAQAAIQAAQAQRAQAQAQQTALEQKAAGPCMDLPGAPRNSTACGVAKASADAAIVSAEATIEAARGQFDVLKRGGSPAQQAKASADVDQAQAQVETARARLEAMDGGITAQRAELQAQKQGAQSQIVQAQEQMKVAQLTLTAARNGNLDAQVKATQANVTAARERLKSDEARLEVILRGPTNEDVAQAQAGIDQAQQQLSKARQPYTTYDLQQQEQAVLQAQAQLARVQNPYTEQDVAAAQSAVDQARAQLDLAHLGVRETTVSAPVDGVISERLVSPGATVSPQAPIVTLVPPALELVVNVEESQLGQVAEGQGVQLSVPAFPGTTFTGTVRSISPTVDSKSRTSVVRIEPNDVDSLRAGMFAQVTIVTAQKSNALLVPNEALVGGSSLIVIDDANTAHRAPVKLGLRGERVAEVLSGVEAGQNVAISNPADLHDGDVVAPRGNSAVALAR